MNRLSILFLFSFFTLTIYPVSAFIQGPQMRAAMIDHVFVPEGHDSNDDVEIVLTGHLSDLCLKGPKSEVKRDGRNIDIEVYGVDEDPNQIFCPQSIMPFEKSIKLGKLDKGLYRIYVNGVDMDEIAVKKPMGDSIDNYNYAYVTSVSHSKDSDKFFLKAYRSSDCEKLDHVKIVSNDWNTYSILPIMKEAKGLCPRKMTPIDIEFEVPQNLSADKMMLHVRSRGGQALNYIF
jgi:hypothetical protein